MAEKKEQRKKLYKKLRNKYRLVILNDSTFEEKFSLRLSQLNVFTIVGLFALFLISLVSILIVFTPIREYIPGYTDVSLHKNMVDLTLKTDSLAHELDMKDAFINNLSLILKDIDPDSNNYENRVDTANNYDADIAFEKSISDSLLRAYVESEDQYNIQQTASATNSKSIKNYIFFTPLKGTITSNFDLDTGHMGIDIVSPENEAIKATLDGTVIFSGWTSETGYVIQLQHENNILSSYKHNSILLKKEGDYVKAGEAIAIVGNSGELTTGPHLHFELWYNGNPMNPEEYMIF